MFRRYAFAFLFAALAVNGANPADVTGSWRLNVDRSVWGSRPKPVSVTLHIQHNEPALSYTGVVIYSGEDMRPFSFTGAIDGKQYAMDRSLGPGTAVCRRVSTAAFECVFRASAGGAVEITRTSIGADGKRLTRRVQLQSSEGNSTSTEIYDRQ